MRRFLLRVLLLIFGCALLLLALSPAYRFLLNQDYERKEDHSLQFKYVPEAVDVACFGSSHAGNAFQAPRYQNGGTLFNFHMALQSPIMDKCLYFHFRDHLASDAIVVVNLSYFSLYLNGTHDVDDFKRYCTFLPVRELPNGAAKLYRLFRIVDFSFNPLASWLLGKTATVDPIATATTTERFSPEELESIGSNRAAEFLGYAGDQAVDPEVDAALNEMLADCLRQGFRPVLVTTPMLRQLNEHLPDDSVARFHADCKRYAQKFGIPYLDYAQDSRFQDALAYFVDTDHLSSNGSEAFMKIFFSDLEAYYPAS